MPLEDLTNAIEGVIWGSRGINVQFTGTTTNIAKNKGDTDSFVDLWMGEKHSLKVKKSKYPVQSGFVISDTAYIEPKKLSLTGYIVNVKSLPYTFGVLSYSSRQHVKSGWATLQNAAKNLDPLNINTNVGSFSNMLITGLSTSIDSSTGTNMVFTLDFEEIKIVKSNVSILSVDNLQGDNNPAGNMTDKTNGGQVQSQNTSLLSSFSNIVGF
jgi:hypothetical protein